MEDITQFKGYCRNLQTNMIYRYEGQDMWTNISTGHTGYVYPEKANRALVLNLEVTQLVNEYPEIENLIRVLSLRIEKNLEDNSACELSKKL